MSDLVRYYREYYREQTPSSIDALFGAMIDYDFSSYHEDMRRVYAMWRETKCSGQAVRLNSNGSTIGIPRKFDFAPHFRIWRHKVEPLLRGKDRKTMMVIAQLGRPDFERFRHSEVLGDPQKDIDAVGNWLCDDDLEMLFDLVVKTYDAYGPINLYAIPDIWTCLVTNPTFRRMVEENKEKISSFVNSDYDAIFKRIGIYVRDQMVDWGSGLNFFECEFGTRHFLPIFFYDRGSCFNLANLVRIRPSNDDRVVFGCSVEKCMCGRTYPLVHMQPHFRNMILDGRDGHFDLLPLHNSLNAHYANLQFHQGEDGAVRMFYVAMSDVDLDIDLVESYFRSGGLKIEFVQGKYYSIGRKKYRAWKSKSVDEQDFLLPKRKPK